MFRVHSVSQRPNLRHLGEPLGGAESLLEAVSFKVTEGMGRGRVANARWERVPHSGGCNTKAKVVRTRGTDNRLVFAERRERVGCGNSEGSEGKQAEWNRVSKCAAPRSSCWQSRAIDGRIMHHGIISSCQSAATSEKIVKLCWS